MNLSFKIINPEDIHYIKQINQNDVEKILQTAISIGFKSLQMSETKIDCHSYIDPLKQMIDDSTSESKNSLHLINEKLNDLLHIKTNSSRKGKLSEDLCCQLLNHKYPSWSFKDVSKEGYEGDCRALETDIGQILYEFKCYDTNVNREQIIKFHRDMEHTGLKYGIFVSNTSGIVGKKNIEWELLNDDKLVIYVSNMGMNGYGCIIATELLLALVSINIFEKDKHYILYQNFNVNDIIENLIPCIDDYRRDLESITKHKQCIRDQKNKINQSMDIIEKNIFQIELNCNSTFSKMMNIIDDIKIEKQPFQEITIDEFIETIINPKMKFYFKQLLKLKHKEYDISIKNNAFYFLKDQQLIAYTKCTKIKMDLIFTILNDQFIVDIRYEKLKNKEIIIEIKDDVNIWSHIQNKFKTV